MGHIYFAAPSKCHPNPCENGAQCTDKYYYMDVISETVQPLTSSSSSSSAAEETNGEASSEAIENITPQQKEETAIISQENGDGRSLPDNIHANDMSKENFESALSGHDVLNHFSLAGFISKKDSIGLKSPTNATRRRRDVGIESLPEGVDKNILDIYGFYCTCPKGFKGLKCERKWIFF